jgi:hypothetical protein
MCVCLCVCMYVCLAHASTAYVPPPNPLNVCYTCYPTSYCPPTALLLPPPGPSKVIVTLAVLNKACAQKDGRVDVIGALTPRSKLLLVALLCENQHCSGGMKQSDIMRAFNTYCDHKGLGSESSSSINGFFQELLMYSVATVVKESNNPEKAKYMVNVTAQLVLQADIGELHAQELRRLVARQEKDRDALTMSQFY